MLTKAVTFARNGEAEDPEAQASAAMAQMDTGESLLLVSTTQHWYEGRGQ